MIQCKVIDGRISIYQMCTALYRDRNAPVEDEISHFQGINLGMMKFLILLPCNVNFRIIIFLLTYVYFIQFKVVADEHCSL